LSLTYTDPESISIPERRAQLLVRYTFSVNHIQNTGLGDICVAGCVRILGRTLICSACQDVKYT